MRSLRAPALAALTALTTLTTLMTAGLLASCSGASTDTGAARPTVNGGVTVDISVSHCGRGWTTGQAGWQRFTVRNTDRNAADVTVIEPTSGAIYAVLDPLGPGRSATIDVQLAPGRYAFRCAVEDEPIVTGATTIVGGSGPTGAPAVIPVTAQDLIPATRAYTAYVEGQLPLLIDQVRELQADLTAKHRGAAEADWLTAHLTYERLGAAYGAFGDADAAINGLPPGGPEGLHHRSFTGFHRIEWGLWHGQPLSTVRIATVALAVQVADLRAHFAASQIDPLEVSIRAHEITENALQFELTGRTDFGSHSALWTIRANLEGTSSLLRILTPLLRPRYAALGETIAAIARAQVDISAATHGSERPALAHLTRRVRERIDADVNTLSELLAPVASILEPRRNT